MREKFNLNNEKGSITVFVLVALLFMSAFLIISYASNVNKSKIAKDQFNIIKSIYNGNENVVDSYQEAYTALRNKNKQIITTTKEENTSTIELSNTFEDKISNYKIYGNSEGIGNTNRFPIDTNNFYSTLSSSHVVIDEDGWMNINFDNTSGTGRTWVEFFPKIDNELSKNSIYTIIVETQSIQEVGGIVITESRAEEQLKQLNSGTYEIKNPTSNTIYYKQLNSLSDFSAAEYMCRSYIYIDSGQNASCKIRLSLIKGEITADNFDGYEEHGKYKIQIKVTDKDNKFQYFNIYLSSQLYENDYIDFKERKISKRGRDRGKCEFA